MKIFLATLYISFAVSLSFAQSTNQSASSRPDFTGIWIFSLSESKGPKSVDMSSNNEVATEIIHKDPEFRIITRNLATNAIESEFVYYTDGHDQTNNGRRAETSKTKWDGNRIVTKAKDRTGDTKTEWTLSADGNKLTEKIKSTTKISYMLNGEVQSVQEYTSEFLKIYDRKSSVANTQSTKPGQQPDILSLIANLEDKSDDVVRKSGYALIDLGPTAISALLDSLSKRKSCRFQFVASGVIYQLDAKHEAINRTLLDITKGRCQGSSQNDLILRRQAAMVLASKTEGIPLVVEMLKDNDTFNRRSSVFAFDELTERIEGMRPDKITPTPEILAAIKKAIPALVEAMNDKDEIVYCMAYESLDQLQRSNHAGLRSEATARMQGVKVKCKR